MKYLAIDFGIKRLGFAFSSPDGIHSFPLCTYERTSRDEMFNFILQLEVKEAINAYVIGLPLTMQLEDSTTTAQVRNFCQSLKRRTKLPIYLIDETLSSFEAEDYLLHIKAKDQKKIIDKVAAMRIMHSFLSYNNKQELLI